MSRVKGVGGASVLGVVSLLSASQAFAEPNAGGATAAFPGPSPTPAAPTAAPGSQLAPATGDAPRGAAPPPSGPPPATYYYAQQSAPLPTYYQGPPPRAAPIPPPEAPEPIPTRRVSLTFSPLHLIQPAFIATVEVRPTDHLGLAVFGGLGSASISVPTSTVTSSNGGFSIQPAHTDRFAYQEIGGQVVGYPLQAFESLEVGLQLLYLHLAGDLPESSGSGAGAGTALGPFVGYKLLTSGGFTLVVQGGAQYLWVSASATSTADGTTTTASDHKVLPLLNFTLGWSF